MTIRTVLYLDISLIATSAALRSVDVALILTVPEVPAFARTIARASPLKAFLSLEEKGTKLVGSPLSVATISPGPVISNVM